MTTEASRPGKRLGAVLFGLAVLAAGCVGTGEIAASPADSAGAGSPEASPPPSAAESASPSPSTSSSAVPAAIAAKTWVTRGPVEGLGGAVAWTLDGRYRLTLPPAEIGLTAADFRVVSVIWTTASDGWITQSTVVVRDLREEGAEIARFELADAIVAADIRDDHAYVFGNVAGPGTIGGIYEASLADGALRVLLPPSAAADAEVPGGTARTGLAVSPSGRTLATAVCRSSRCTTQVVDLGTGQVRELATNAAWPWWLSDSTVVVGDTGWRSYGYDLSGRLRWAREDRHGEIGYVTADGSRLVVQYESAQPGTWISLTDLASGAERVVRAWDGSEPRPWLWPDVSTDDVAVLLPEDPGALEHRDLRADLLDLRTGALTPGALLVSAR